MFVLKKKTSSATDTVQIMTMTDTAISVTGRFVATDVMTTASSGELQTYLTEFSELTKHVNVVFTTGNLKVRISSRRKIYTPALI